MARTFEETDVWKESRELVKFVYKLTKSTQFRKDHGLVDQVRRASVSVLSNIAEGFERGSNAELMHYLYVAKERPASCELRFMSRLTRSILHKRIS
jgi:four helix bundle protein